MTTEEIEQTLKKLGNLIIRDYVDGRIDQQDQTDMLALVNHLSLKDFVKEPKKKDAPNTTQTQEATTE